MTETPDSERGATQPERDMENWMETLHEGDVVRLEVDVEDGGRQVVDHRISNGKLVLLHENWLKLYPDLYPMEVMPDTLADAIDAADTVEFLSLEESLFGGEHFLVTDGGQDAQEVLISPDDMLAGTDEAGLEVSLLDREAEKDVEVVMPDGETFELNQKNFGKLRDALSAIESQVAYR